MDTNQANTPIPRLGDDEVLSRVLFRDGLILVFDKPSGIAVHKAGQGRHNLEQYFHLLRFGLPKAPALAHRLDRGTSGCLVLARHRVSAQRLQALFSQGKISKIYFAVVHGAITTDVGRIDLPLSKQSHAKGNWRMKADLDGSITAVTDYVVVMKTPNWSLLKLNPLTGRTHQLRVHCQAIGHPIMGDDIYGHSDGVHKLHLHAHQITIPLYPKKEPLVVTAAWPSHMPIVEKMS